MDARMPLKLDSFLINNNNPLALHSATVGKLYKVADAVKPVEFIGGYILTLFCGAHARPFAPYITENYLWERDGNFFRLHSVSKSPQFMILLQ